MSKSVATREMALRLAWYADRHGEIPPNEIVKLWGITTGLPHLREKDDAARIAALAKEIQEYFESMDQSKDDPLR